MIAWPVLTEERIASFVCQDGKSQSIYWDGACPGLGVRVTKSGFKAFVFDTKVRHVADRVGLRITIGDVRAWPIDQARAVARRYKRLADMGIDPRDTLPGRAP